MSTATQSGQPSLRQSRHHRVVSGEAIESFGIARHCPVEGCGTVLSRYNPSATCAVHAGWQDTRQRSHA